MKEPELGKNEVQLTSIHRLAVEPRNLVLRTRYQKQAGRGAERTFIDEYDYDRGLHYNTLRGLGNRLGDIEFLAGLSPEVIGEVSSAKEMIDKSLERLDNIKAEMVKAMEAGIVINTGKGDRDE